jgi:hypothetical protein
MIPQFVKHVVHDVIVEIMVKFFILLSSVSYLATKVRFLSVSDNCIFLIPDREIPNSFLS